MRKTETVELTVLCLVTDRDRILLQNRVKDDWKGYTLPGGHVETGESFVDAVIREMKEETGLDISNPKLVGVKQFPMKNGNYEEGRYIVFLFKTEEYKGTLQSSEEGEMKWVTSSELKELDTVDDLEGLLKVMNSPEITEFQYIVEDDEWKILIR